MRTLCTLLLCISNLKASSQSTPSFESGEAFAIQMKGNEITTQVRLGSGGRVTSNVPAKIYTVSWIQNDGNKKEMKFTNIRRIEELMVFKEEAGNHYVIDTQHLITEGVFVALQVDIKNKLVRDRGLLMIGLKRH